MSYKCTEQYFRGTRIGLTTSFLVILSAFTLFASKSFGDSPAKEVPEETTSKTFTNLNPFQGIVHKWDKSVRGFRKGHNFSVLAGYNTAVFSQNNESLAKTSLKSISTRLRYSYHIQTNNHLGYFLGTALGYVALNPNFSSNDIETLGSYVELPGLVVGGVYNASSVFRAYSALEGFLTRIDDFKRPPLDTPIDGSGTSVRMSLGFDFFYKLDWAIRLESSYSWTFIRVPSGNDGLDNPNIKEVVVSGSNISIGLVLHII